MSVGPAKSERLSGILLHVTSLPSYGGIGDLGPAAYTFVDFLVAAKQRLWQVLPLSPTGYGSSPYSALSAFAGNPLLLSVQHLERDGWLSGEQIAGLPGNSGPADFAEATRCKLPVIEAAASNFLHRASPDQRAEYEQFCQGNQYWLASYALFNVLRREFGYVCWADWPTELAQRQPAALAEARARYAHQVEIEQVIQFLFHQQWSALRQYCHQHEITILGDVAIFVNYDSADVWANPEIFDLDDSGRPLHVSGVPPDYFSATGQRWGNPLYRWDLLEQRGFDWWVERVRRSLALYDSIRLDHFRGFEAYWCIDAAEETAINGTWVKAPGQQLFARLRQVFGQLPFLAEDLGVITPEVDALRESFGLPGMRVLQFGFSDRGAHMHLPHRFVPNSVVYTGTHDNNTTLGWWRDDASAAERTNLQTYLQPIEHDGQIVWTMVRAAARSVANCCIFPLQDILHIGSEGRMNVPAASTGNWAWRFHPDALHPDFASQLAAITEVTDRDGYVPPAPQSDAAHD
ncbi:MAG: 4-alpha-glucanotransferase [Acidobacteriota bacterium]|nr:4-alpha-glucanotransferase [Acidobacteriota bacterium]